MSSMSKPSEIIAVLCSDLHMSHKPPIARSVEHDWYEVQERYLTQLDELSQKHGSIPIICAGDVFDKGNPPPELINFLLSKMPNIISIVGQHDLINHNYGQIYKSAYWTLVKARKIDHIKPGYTKTIPTEHEDIVIHGFNWGYPVLKNIRKKGDKRIHLALVHDYVWWKDAKYQEAPKEKSFLSKKGEFEGYNTVVIGDNHKGWWIMPSSDDQEGPWVINCGTFIRRKIDEIHYQPQVGLLHKSGAIKIHLLDTSEDKFIDPDEVLEVIEKGIESVEFLRELKGLAKTLIEFGSSVQQFCERNGVSNKVRKVLNEVLED